MDKTTQTSLYAEISEKIIGWVKGQILLSLAVGLLSGVALHFIGIPYAIPLAFFIALMAVIPYVGSLIGFIPAFILAFIDSPKTLVYTILSFIIIQVAEAYVLQPLIMKKTLGLNPFMVFAAVIIGQIFFGPLGALLAVPAMAIALVIKDHYAKNQDSDEKIKPPRE